MGECVWESFDEFSTLDLNRTGFILEYENLHRHVYIYLKSFVLSVWDLSATAAT